MKMTVTLPSFDNFKLRGQNYSGKMIPFFNPENYPFLNEFYSSIMTGEDSPISDKREEFNYGRSTPPPTTSHLVKIDNADAKTAAQPIEGDKENVNKIIEKENIDVLQQNTNPEFNSDENEIRKDELKKNKCTDDHGDHDDKDKLPKKINGTDMLDGQWIPSQDSKIHTDDEEEEEEDNCTVKCLYYTMQCCECTIS